MRLDKYVLDNGHATTRTQGESLIRLGEVKVNGKVQKKPGFALRPTDQVEIAGSAQYVSRAGLKLASVARELNIDFTDTVVLDVGSSTGGFTDYALQNGAKKVIAIELGTNQMHPTLRNDPRIELHEKTDIREVAELSEPVDIVVIDVSFIGLHQVLPAVQRLIQSGTIIVAMLKPQFEAAPHQKNRGIVKNSKFRKTIIADFENRTTKDFIILGKRDSAVAGAKGNVERFYTLKAK